MPARGWDRADAPAGERGHVKVTVLNPKHVLFEGEAASVFLPGDLAEFELLDYGEVDEEGGLALAFGHDEHVHLVLASSAWMVSEWEAESGEA